MNTYPHPINPSQAHPSTRIPNSCCCCSWSQKPSHAAISGTKRGIIDPLVSKQPARRTNSRRPEGPKAGTKGRRQEVGAPKPLVFRIIDVVGAILAPTSSSRTCFTSSIVPSAMWPMQSWQPPTKFAERERTRTRRNCAMRILLVSLCNA